MIDGREEVDLVRDPGQLLDGVEDEADAACMSGEFLPVTMVPSGSSMAAPTKTPLFPFPVALASSAARRAGPTTAPVLGLDPELLHQQLGPLDGLLLDEAQRVFAGVAEIAPDELLLGRFAARPRRR